MRLTCQACTTTTPTTTTTTTTSGPLLKRSYVDEAVLCRTGPLPKRRSSEMLLCRSSPLPRRTCATAVLCQSGPRPKGSSATCGHLCRSAACVWTVECVECVGVCARVCPLSCSHTLQFTPLLQSKLFDQIRKNTTPPSRNLTSHLARPCKPPPIGAFRKSIALPF